MRTLLPLLGLPLALALWAGSLWWGLPWGVSLRLEPRPQTTVAAPVVGQVLQATMRRSVPGIDGIALGDRVQGDRYGVLAPVAGRVLCVWLPPGSLPVETTMLGGAPREANLVELDYSSPAECPVPAR